MGKKIKNILLVEPNYKNKYPPIGLMKLATYYRTRGDNVIFFKGNLKDLATELVCENLFKDLEHKDNKFFWNKYYQNIFDFVKSGHYKHIEHINILMEASVLSLLKFYRKKYKEQDYFINPKFDIVAVTTLFTFYWDITIETINFVKQLCKYMSTIMVGGMMATILPDRVFEATGIHPRLGLLDKPYILDDDDDRIIDHLPLDYSILDEIDYTYPTSNAYFVHTTRGCPNKCSFCAVPKLEPTYCHYKSIKESIDYTNNLFGSKKDLLLMDNNILASGSYNKIIDDIKSCGFEYNSTYVPPDDYDISIRNLRAGYNDRAYIKKIVKLYDKFFEQLKQSTRSDLYDFIKDKYCLNYYSATKESILEIDDFIKLNNIKLRKTREQKRYVDFNQGVEAKLVTYDNMSKLAETSIRPLRIAFDHWALRDIYTNAIISAVQNNINYLSNYILYNHNDTPNELYLRLRLNVELCEELNANIYSFPMKYHPIDDPNFFSNRNYQGKYWNKKYLRAIQCMLNSTKGKVGRGLSFFDFNFGANLEDFNKLLLMPELFIINRVKFKTLSDTWWLDFNKLTEEQQDIAKVIIFTNDFATITDDIDINSILNYYILNI